MRRILRGIYYVAGGLLILLLALIGFSQTRLFKSYLRDWVLQESQTALLGTLTLGSIDGNLATGFVINGFSLQVHGHDVLTTDKFEIQYDPLTFFLKRVVIPSATIIHPKITLYRSIDGTWNIAEIIKPTPSDTTPSSWKIEIKRIVLEQAEVTLVDSLLLRDRQRGIRIPPTKDEIDYANITLKNVSLSASVFIDKDQQKISLAKLEATSSNPDFQLKRLQGNFSVSKNEAVVNNLSIETRNSKLFLDVSLKKADILHLHDLRELESKPISLTLTADHLDTKELKQFLYPWVDFIDGSIVVQLKASGTFDNIRLERLSLELPHSKLQFQGTISNLHHPRDLRLNVTANDNVATASEILRTLPGLHLPNLSYLGETHYSLSYEGAPTDFHAHLDATSDVGSLDIDGTMKLHSKNAEYNITSSVHHLALGTILGTDRISSNLNARLTVSGTGFSPQTMSGVGKLEIDSSSINGHTLHRSVVVVDAADGFIDSHILLSVNNSRSELSGMLNYKSADSLLYSYSGKFLSIDLAELLQDNAMASNLSMNVQGKGIIGTNCRDDSAGIRFLRSSFGDAEFDHGDIQYRYQSSNVGVDSLRFSSPSFDVDAVGKFSTADLVNGISHAVQMVYEGAAHRIQTLDSVKSTQHNLLGSKGFHPPFSFPAVDAAYHISVKDFSVLGTLLHTPMKGTGTFQGKFKSDSGNASLDGQCSLKKAGYRSNAATLTAAALSMNYAFDGLNKNTFYRTMHSTVDLHVQDAAINALDVNEGSLQCTVTSDSIPFQVQMLLDSSVTVEGEGTARYTDNIYSVVMPSLQINLGKSAGENIDTVRIDMGCNGLDIQSLQLSHELAELSVTGLFNPKGYSDLTYTVTNFFLADLKEILRRTSYGSSATSFSGIIDMNGSFRGTLAEPKISAGIRIEATGIDHEESDHTTNRTVLRRVAAHLAYADQILDLDVRLHSHPENVLQKPDLLLSGSVPYHFSFVAQPEQKLSGSMDLLVQAQNFNLSFIGPFIPELSNLTGLLQCDIKMRGDIELPQYEGSMTINDANFLFKPLEIRYTLNGELLPAGDHVQLNNVVIRNMNEERHVGTLNVGGNLYLEGLKLRSFDLLANGTLLVMKEENRIPGQSFYGNVFIGTGQTGLNWKGNLTASTLRGTVYVRDAQLILPPERESQWIRATGIKMSYVDDTTKVSQIVSTIDHEESNIDTTFAVRSNKQNKAIDTVRSQTFLDGISYDLVIETQGVTQLRFIFNTQTSEELSADLNGRINFNRADNVSRLTGQVEVTDRSYYNFLKKFQASGKLLFTGSLLNPELDVTATYEGTHRRDTTRGVYSTLPTASQDVGTTQKVVVTMVITGPRIEPKVKFKITQNDVPRETGEEESDAIAFILSGQFRDELTDQQRTSMIGSNVGLGLASGMVFGPLSEALRRSTMGYIQSIDVLYYGGQFSSAADLRLTGQVGEAVYRIGGRVLNDLNNTNASVELPVSSITGSTQLRNLIFSLEHRVETIDNVDEQRRATNALKLMYRFSF